MRVYVLHLDGPSALARAFDHVLESPEAASCMIEPKLERIRFLAAAGAADALVERIYLDGGLLWCSRYDTTEQPSTEEVEVSGQPSHPA